MLSLRLAGVCLGFGTRSPMVLRLSPATVAASSEHGGHTSDRGATSAVARAGNPAIYV